MYIAGLQVFNNTKIIKRYDAFIDTLGHNYVCYMDGWKQFTNINNNTNIERIPVYLINFQNIHNNDINIVEKATLKIILLTDWSCMVLIATARVDIRQSI